MTVLELEDSIQDVVIKMSDNNPGAINILMSFLISKDKFDYVLMLDSIGLYGSNIYKLANDCCNNDEDKFLKVLDDWQKSIISSETILENVENNGFRGKPVEDWL